MKTESPYEQLNTDVRARIHRTRKREATSAMLEGLLLCAAIFVTLTLVVLLLEQIFYLRPVVKTALFWTVLSSTALLFVLKAARPLLVVANVIRGDDDLRVAARIGEFFPQIGDRLLNALQMSSHDRDSGFYSTTLIDEALKDVYRDLAGLDLDKASDFSGPRRWAIMFSSAAGAAILLFVLFPTSFFGALDRVWNHDQSFAAPAPFRLVVEPGNLTIVKGEPVAITVRAEGTVPPTVILAMKPSGEVQEEMVELTPSADGTFRHDIPGLRYSLMYYCRAADVQSDEYELTIVDRPVLKVVRLTLEPPAYSGMGPRELDENAGNATVLRGTTVTVRVEATKRLGEASMTLGDGSSRPLEVDGSAAKVRFRAMADMTYELHLKDESGLESVDPVRYTIKVGPDELPRIAIEIPGMDLDVAGNEELGFVIRVSDDYGFSRLRLAYRLTQSRYEQPAAGDSYVDIPLPPGVRSEGIVPFQWPLRVLSLVPEDVITYHAEVFDNDDVSGPKGARSEEYTLRLPSMEEVFADAEKTQETGIENLEKALEGAREAKKGLDEFQREMKQKQETMKWQEQKQAGELADRYKEVQQKINDVTAAVDSMIREMKKNEILSAETLRKYEELRELMEELNSPELADALKKFQEAMQNLDPESLKDALQQLNLSEEQFRKNIERTINLLKRIQIEQKVDEVIRRTEELLKRQEEVREATENAKEDPSALAERQEDLARQLAALEQELKDLEKMMQQFPSEMPLEEMEQALAELDSSGLAEQMQEISKQMNRRQMSQAGKGQKNASQKMGSLLDQLRQMQDMLRRNQQQQIVNELRKVYQDLLELSRREEDLKDETSGLQSNSPQFREGRGGQMEVLRDLGTVTERLSAVAQKSFGVTPDMGRPIGEAMQQMNAAMDALDQRNGASATSLQAGAMASLNEAAQNVQAGMNAMMQGEGQGMGMAGLMQQLQGMSSMQQGINQGTRNLGGMGERKGAEMGRLAGEQGMARKSMEQLAKEAARQGDMSRLLGDLNRIAQEMREVQTDLAQGNVRPETIRKQERILSRLLDSQRSMRERDYEKTRKAESGKEHRRERVPETTLSSKDLRDRLQDDLNRARSEGYARDYQELIRKYFELLETEETPR